MPLNKTTQFIFAGFTLSLSTLAVAKTGSLRKVTMLPQLFTALLAWRNKRHSESTKLFENKGSWVPARHIEHRYNRAFRAAGVNLTGTHCLRHTYATLLLNQGVTIPTLQRLLGHTKIETTMRYAKLMDVTVDAELAGVGDVLAGVCSTPCSTEAERNLKAL